MAHKLVEAVYYENDNSPHCPCLTKLNVDCRKPENDSYGSNETEELGKHFYFKRYCPNCNSLVKYYTTFGFERLRTHILSEEEIEKIKAKQSKRKKKGG